LVLGPEKQIEVHGQPVEGQFSQQVTHGPGGSLTSQAVPSLTVDLTALFGA
jgi:hypothetical protein